MNLKTRCLMDIEDYFEMYADCVRAGSRGSHIFIDNGCDVLAVAHLDYVGRNHFAVAELGDLGNVVFSPSLDDRLGAHIILDVLPEMGVCCDVLLTDGEEIGRSTAADFETDKKYNWMFSFDRRGDTAVMYQYSAVETRAAAKEAGFTVGFGSYSDIASLSHLGCAGFNFGTGYSNEHTRMCHAVLGEVFLQIDKFAMFWDRNRDRSFRGTYTRRYGRGGYGGGYSGYGRGYRNRGGDYDDDYYTDYYHGTGGDTTADYYRSRDSGVIDHSVTDALRKTAEYASQGFKSRYHEECAWCGEGTLKSNMCHWDSKTRVCKECAEDVRGVERKRDVEVLRRAEHD